MDIYEEEARKEKRFEQATIKRKSEDTVRIITKEGYIFDVTEQGIEYLGKQDEDSAPPELKNGDIEFEYIPSGWTNGNVKVKILIKNEELKKEDYILEYSRDSKEWNKYTEEIEFEQNGSIYARIINKLDMIGEVVTGNVLNIDKMEPNDITFTTSVTPISITVNGNANDAPKTDTNGCSGIAEYYYSINNGTWQTSNVFEGLSPSTTYQIKIKVVDNARNVGISETKNVTTNADIINEVLLESNPTKMDYLVTENVNYSGIKLRIKYKYGTQDQIIDGSPYASSTVNNDSSNNIRYNITVNYSGYTFNILTYKESWYTNESTLQCYYYEDRKPLTNVERYLPNHVGASDYGYYRFKADGNMHTGWYQQNDGWVYYIEGNGSNIANSALLIRASSKDDISTLISTSELCNKEKFERGGKITDTRWLHIRKQNSTIEKYYYVKNGIMQTGWQNIGGETYYLETNGEMATEWKTINGITYYLNEGGNLQKGWRKISDKYYYFNTSTGAMQTGWLQDDNKWYYLKSNGVMCDSEWLQLDGKWYYFKPYGIMCKNEYYVIDGKTYNFDTNGVCTNP